MNFRYLIVFITIILFSNNVYSTTPVYSKELESIFPNIKLRVTQRERRIVSNLKQLHKLSKKGILNKHLFKKLYREMSNSKTFKAYRFWPKHILQLSSNNNIYTLKKYCSIRKNKSYQDHIKNELNKNLVYICYNKYLHALGKNSKKNLKFHKQEKKFVAANIEHIATAQNIDELENVLNNFRKNSSRHKLYSDIISNHYISKNITPPKDLLKYMYIRPNFTRFIQSREMETFSTQYVFYTELRKLKKNAFDVLDEKRSYVEIKNAFVQTLNYFNLTFQHQPKDKAILTLQSISKSLMRRGYFDLAQQGFRRILNEKSFHYNSTVFNHIWSYVLQKDYQQALAVLDFYKLDDDFLKKNTKVKFWISYVHQKLSNDSVANKFFNEIIEEDPLSFYAILSAKILGEDSKKSTTQVYLGNLNKGRSPSKITSNKINKKWLKRMVLWSEFYLPKFLSLDIKNIQHLSPHDTEKNILTAAYMLSKNNEYLESFKIIYKSINTKKLSLTGKTIQILFPRPYIKQIRNNTKNFDPVIALSLIRQESGFNRRARSHVGARGLMQLMPNTAKQFKRRLKTKHLYRPNLNIKIGTKYFNNLLDRYDNNLVYSLAAYNAGENRVDRWQGDYLNRDSILENIENIPFNETRKYVKLIFRNIFFYKMIFNKQLEDQADLNKIYDVHLGFES